jgi:hypothetical protein
MDLSYIKNDSKEERAKRIAEVKFQLEAFEANPELKNTDAESYKIALKVAKICGVIN